MGDVADAIFFVKSGELVCHTGGMNHEDKIRLKRARSSASRVSSRTSSAVRKANVVAVGNVTVFKLTRDVFHEQLGDLEGLVADNFKRKVLEGMTIEGTPIFNKLPVEDQVSWARQGLGRTQLEPEPQPQPQTRTRTRALLRTSS